MATRYKLLHSGMGVVSSSAQIDYNDIQNIPTGSTATASWAVNSTSASYALTASYVIGGSSGDGVPLGTIVLRAQTDNSTNYLVCNNQVVNTQSYSELKTILDQDFPLTYRTSTDINSSTTSPSVGSFLPIRGSTSSFLHISSSDMYYNDRDSNTFYPITTESLALTFCFYGSGVSGSNQPFADYFSGLKTQQTQSIIYYFDTTGSVTATLNLTGSSGTATSSLISHLNYQLNSSNLYSYYQFNANSVMVYKRSLPNVVSSSAAAYYNPLSGAPVGACSNTGIWLISSDFRNPYKMSFNTSSYTWYTSSVFNTYATDLRKTHTGDVYSTGIDKIYVLEGGNSGSTWSLPDQISNVEFLNDTYYVQTKNYTNLYSIDPITDVVSKLNPTGEVLDPTGLIVTRSYSDGSILRHVSTSDGTLYSISNTPGQKMSVMPISNISTIRYFPSNTFFITTSSLLYGIGSNTYGQLGQGNTTASVVTFPVLISTDAVNVFVNSNDLTVFYIKSDNSLWGMGHNNLGTLGDGTFINRSSSVLISNDVSAVFTSSSYDLYYLKTNGDLYGTGRNLCGEIGNGTTSTVSSSYLISTGVSDVYPRMSGSYYTTHYLKSSGQLYGMGWNDVGQIGDGTVIQRSSSVLVGSNVKTGSVYIGANVTYHCKTDGYLYANGSSLVGQCGQNGTYRATPTLVNSSPNVDSASVKTNGYTTYWRENSGSTKQVYGIGSNTFGQITTTPSYTYSWSPKLLGTYMNEILPSPNFATVLLVSTASVVNGANDLYLLGRSTGLVLSPTPTASAIQLISRNTIDRGWLNSGFYYNVTGGYSTIVNSGSYSPTTASVSAVYSYNRFISSGSLIDKNVNNYINVNYTNGVTYIDNITYNNTGKMSTDLDGPDILFQYKPASVNVTKSYWATDQLERLIPSGYADNYPMSKYVIAYKSGSTYRVSFDGGVTNVSASAADIFSSGYMYQVYNGKSAIQYPQKIKRMIEWDGWVPYITVPVNSGIRNLNYVIKAK